MQDINLNRIWNNILKSFIPQFLILRNPFSSYQLFYRNMFDLIKCQMPVYKNGQY
jgi:hypothetical protein